MGRIIKRDFVICILVILLADTAIGYLLFKSRAFSHLAIWNIIESNKQEDFYWQPEDAPGYFYFEPDSNRITVFRNEASVLIKNKSDELKMVLEVAKYVMDIKPGSIYSNLSLKWDSPEGMLRQIRAGAKGAHCFHRSILFSTYLANSGMKSRLWALENEGFNGTAHSVTEVYIKSLKKWVFIDVTFGFYITENGWPLSLLELREKLLNGFTNILVQDIGGEINKSNKLPLFYSRLVKCVFLRADNDFVNKFNNRYGVFSIFQKYLDKFPDNIRRGLDYLLGRQDIFVHYVDTFSRSLKAKIIAAKLFFYFFIVSLAFISILLAMLFLSFLKHRLLINLSKKDTRHK